MPLADAIKSPRRSILGPIRAVKQRTATPARKAIGRPIPGRCFDNERKALAWGNVHGDENCFQYQRWEVEPYGGVFAVGIYSLNSGDFSHWAE